MRRLKAGQVLILSVIFAVVCLAVTVWLLVESNFLFALLPAALAVWFGVDAYRAWRWTRTPPS